MKRNGYIALASMLMYFLYFAEFSLPVASKDSFRKGTIIDSPNKKYAIQDLGYSSNDSDRFHTYLIEKALNKRRPLLIPSTGSNYYDHPNVDYWWSPDSRKFAMSEVAPSLGDVYLFDVNDPDHPIVLSKKLELELRKQLGQIDGSLNNCLHLYVEVKRWIDSKSIELAVDFAYQRHDLKGEELKRCERSGTWPGATFAWLYSWDLESSFKKIRRLSKSEI